jgi:hypothetical protein
MSDDDYRDFEDALAAVLLEGEFNPARRRRLQDARAKVDQNDPRYVAAVNRAFAFLDCVGPSCA